MYASIDQYYISRYKDLHQIKSSKKGLINDYLKKKISSISRVQDKSSKVVEKNIWLKSRGMSSSNIYATSDKSYFITSCITSP